MLPPVFFLLFFLVVLAGTLWMSYLVKKKWGYTEKREKELEEESDKMQISVGKKGRK